MHTFMEGALILVFATLIASSPALAKEPRNQDPDPFGCVLVCWTGMGNLFGCNCGGSTNPPSDPTACRQWCSNQYYSELSRCRQGKEPGTPEYEECLVSTESMMDECLSHCV